MKRKVLILVNHNVPIYNFRKELVERLVSDGYEVYLSCPQGIRIEELVSMGCIFIETDVERRGMNPFKDFMLIIKYKKIIKEVKPDIVLTYTIKPNVYGGIASASLKIPQIPNVTGLGTSIEDGGLSSKFILWLYKLGLKKSKLVFFQNESNLNFFKDKGIVGSNYELLPGSGVNLEQHYFEEYPENTDETVFLIIGRLMKNKGTDEILEAAEVINSKYDNVCFRFIGFYDDDYKQKVDDAINRGIVEFCGNQTDVHPFIKNSHATILASYHEGMSNVLLETAATGRPVIATDIPGCIETFDPYVSGIPFKPKDSADLVRAIEEFLALSYEEKKAMGIAGRKKVEKQFDRQIVVNKYIEEIEKEVN